MLAQYKYPYLLTYTVCTVFGHRYLRNRASHALDVYRTLIGTRTSRVPWLPFCCPDDRKCPAPTDFGDAVITRIRVLLRIKLSVVFDCFRVFLAATHLARADHLILGGGFLLLLQLGKQTAFGLAFVLLGLLPDGRRSKCRPSQTAAMPCQNAIFKDRSLQFRDFSRTSSVIR